MCPICFSAAAVIAASGVSTAGIGTAMVGVVRRQKKEPSNDQSRRHQ
jgi:hypothetical protein